MAPTTATNLAAVINAQSGFNPEMIIGSFVPDKPSTTISALTTIVTSASLTHTSVSFTTTTAGTSYSTEVTRPHWTTSHVSFRNLSVWAYLALGVIMFAAAIVLGYAVYSCCRTAVRVERVVSPPSTGDNEDQGETGNANGNGGEAVDGNEKKHQVDCLVTPTRNPRVHFATRSRNQDRDIYSLDFHVNNNVNGAEPKGDSSEWSSRRKKRFGVVDLSKLLSRVVSRFRDADCYSLLTVGAVCLQGWGTKTACEERQGSREMKTVTPPRRNRNGWHANDCADAGMYSYPYALEYERSAPAPAYTRSSMARLWKEPKLSPVGGRVVLV